MPINTCVTFRGDHTFADSYITVLPKGTEFVVFSIDGSFAASVSIMGSDPKVRAGAVDVVRSAAGAGAVSLFYLGIALGLQSIDFWLSSRHWQDLGYLIIYVTGRPDMQKQRVVAWLAQHNFPHGIVSFCDGLVHDPLRHKANFLKSLITDVSLGLLKYDRSTRLDCSSSNCPCQHQCLGSDVPRSGRLICSFYFHPSIALQKCLRC